MSLISSQRQHPNAEGRNRQSSKPVLRGVCVPMSPGKIGATSTRMLRQIA